MHETEARREIDREKLLEEIEEKLNQVANIDDVKEKLKIFNEIAKKRKAFVDGIIEESPVLKALSENMPKVIIEDAIDIKIDYDFVELKLSDELEAFADRIINMLLFLNKVVESDKDKMMNHFKDNFDEYYQNYKDIEDKELLDILEEKVKKAS